jgi:hypothetical protein
MAMQQAGGSTVGRNMAGGAAKGAAKAAWKHFKPRFKIQKDFSLLLRGKSPIVSVDVHS